MNTKKPNLLLLHGALASKEQMTPLSNLLQSEIEVHAFSFTGHGGLPIPDAGFTMDDFVQDIFQYMEKRNLQTASLFGYSMGGYAALLASLSTPWQFEKVITLGVKLDWTPESAALEMQQLNTDKMQEKIPAFVKHLEKIHAPNEWIQVVEATKEMMKHLGEKPDLTEGIQWHDMAALMLYGSDDKTAGTDASLAIARQHPYGEVVQLPGVGHPFEKMKMEALAKLLKIVLLKS
ncbi:MAG: alpha/beta fold hydrolase [Flavobacteriales bacterium]